MSSERRSTSWFEGWRVWALGFAFFTANGLLRFWYFYLDVLTRGHTEPFHTKLIEELTGSWGEGLLVPLVFWAARRFKRPRSAWLLHVPMILAVSALHTTWNWWSRLGAFALLGYGHYDYGLMRWRYLMELPSDLIGYFMLATFILLFDHYASSRRREVRLAELETEVARVRLQVLEAQLQPHFLFNALNTISSVMYQSVEKADRMLAALSDLLRRSLRTEGSGQVTLAEELETLGSYLELLRARFGDRLSVTVDADPSLVGQSVPHLLLQPLVENAVEHGDPGPGRAARIVVRAVRGNGSLLLTVRDNGPGLAVAEREAVERGIGLSNARRRLERLYGERGRLRLENQQDGGVLVSVTIPCHG